MVMRRIARTMPVPISSIPPPTAGRINKYPISVNIGPLPLNRRRAGHFLSDYLRLADDGGLALHRGQQKRVLLAGSRNSIAHDETGIIGRLGHGEHLKPSPCYVGNSVQINHLTIGEEKCVHRSVSGRGISYDLAQRIRAEGAALRSAQRPEICHSLVGITEGVVGGGVSSVGHPGGAFAGARHSCAARAAKST